MAILVLDPMYEAQMRSLWPGLEYEGATEVWEGVTVVPPIPTDEHQDVAGRLYTICYTVIEDEGLGKVRPPINLSDRVEDWGENYRNPDMSVFLNNTAAVNYDSHWVGGPDFAVEVISPGEKPTAKFAFYESIGTKELFIVHRKPWKLELFTLSDGKLKLASTSALLSAAVCASAALGLTFQLVEGTRRPRITVVQPSSGRTWLV